LFVAGAALGALAAGGALATAYALRGQWVPYFYGDAVAAAWVGGTLGLLVGPACGLTFLRRVQLWRALLGTTLAAYAGGVLGELWWSGVFGALAAVQLTVLWLAGHDERAVARAAAGARARPPRMPGGRAARTVAAGTPATAEPPASGAQPQAVAPAG
jgi:MFS family permease